MLVHMWIRKAVGYQEASKCYMRDESEESIACRQQTMQARDPL